MVKSIPTSNKFYALYQDDETSLSDGASETEGQRWEPLRPKKKIVKKAKVVPKKVEIPAVEADTPEPEEKGYQWNKPAGKPKPVDRRAGVRKVAHKRSRNQMLVNVRLEATDDRRTFEVKALLDSGCTSTSIDRKFVAENKINTYSLPRPIPVRNADGTSNRAGDITKFVVMRMIIEEHEELRTMLVTDLGKTAMFIGYDWLNEHDPTVFWRDGRIVFNRCPTHCAQNKEAELARVLAGETPSYFEEFEEVFAKESFDQLPPHRPWDHVIDLKPGNEAPHGRCYPLSSKEKEELDTFLDENLRTGRIRPSKSPYASPFFFRTKPEGALRPIQDYRKLNEITIKNRYPLPLISDLIDQLSGAKWFTKRDLRWGFNNVRIREGDEEKAAFITPRGLFEPTVMQFGLCNAPATFQRMMNEILKEEIATGKVVCYIDDILIFTATIPEHREMTRRVLERLRDNRLYCKPEKCMFEQKSVEWSSRKTQWPCHQASWKQSESGQYPQRNRSCKGSSASSTSTRGLATPSQGLLGHCMILRATHCGVGKRNSKGLLRS